MAPADKSTGKCSQFIPHSSRSNITSSTQIPNPYGCMASKVYLTLGSDHVTESCPVFGRSCSLLCITNDSTYHHIPLNSGVLPWARPHVDMTFTIFRKGIPL